MKNLLFIFIALLSISCGNKNGKANVEKENLTQTRTNDLAEFEFTEEMHNFGALQSGEIVVYPFEFKNSGNNNLIINNIETDCGCINAEFPKKPVLPGESGIIEVEFDSSGMWGKQLKTIEIHANTKKPKQLIIFAEVKNEQLEINN